MTVPLPEDFRRNTVLAGGIRINTLVSGRGSPVLLLHGYPQTHVMWHHVAPRLAEHHTVVLADLRGYGDSGKHWFFLAQPEPLPEHLLGADPEGWVRGRLSALRRGGQPFDPAAVDEYVRCYLPRRGAGRGGQRPRGLLSPDGARRHVDGQARQSVQGERDFRVARSSRTKTRARSGL